MGKSVLIGGSIVYYNTIIYGERKQSSCGCRQSNVSTVGAISKHNGNVRQPTKAGNIGSGS
jgi:hypothetical protein